MPLPLESAPGDGVRLPIHGTTVTADDLRVQLVVAADAEDELVIDASEVESIGQAVLQLLVAARNEAAERGQRFVIADPSPAFSGRVSACGLAELLGLESQGPLQ